MSGNKADISLGYSCNKEDWNQQAQMIKSKHTDKSYVLNLTNSYRKRVFDIYQHYLQRGVDCTVDIIKQRLSKNSNGFISVYPTLIELFERALERKIALSGKNNSTATVSKYNRCKIHLINFMRTYLRMDDIDCNKIDLRFIEDFELYLKTKGNCCNNTTMKYIQTFKTIYKMALAYGYTQHDPFLNFKIKMEEVNRTFLSENEITSLIDFNCIKMPSLLDVRDLFLFSCYTGLSYIDMANLKIKHLVFDSGMYWIKTKREKTGIKSNIPLLDFPLQIILKYCSDFTNNSNIETPLLRVISNQKINEKLKLIAKMCKINKHLTFHLARHTFATTITLNNGVPIESVSSMLGHKHITTTQHYAKLLDKRVGEDMNRLKILLDKNAN
jgi:site-specific recombinase XerD